MRFTRVLYKKPGAGIKPLAVCDVVLDNCLRVTDIKLYRKNGKYYLVLPSKQDIYQAMSEVNKGIDLRFPSESPCVGGKTKCNYEEFYYPVNKEFYQELLNVVVEGYKKFKTVHNKYEWTFVPSSDSGGCNGKEKGDSD